MYKAHTIVKTKTNDKIKKIKRTKEEGEKVVLRV